MVEKLVLKCLGGTLCLNVFAGQITITPIVEQIGDTIALDRSQAHLLMLYLQERLGYGEPLNEGNSYDTD